MSIIGAIKTSYYYYTGNTKKLGQAVIEGANSIIKNQNASTASAKADDTPTNTPTEFPTAPPEDTSTPTATNSPTATGTPSPEPTETPTASPTPAPVETNTPTPEPTNTPTSTPSASPTSTWTATNTPYHPPTVTPTPTPTKTPTATPTSTATQFPTMPNTPTLEPTETPTPEDTPSPTPTEAPIAPPVIKIAGSMDSQIFSAEGGFFTFLAYVTQTAGDPIKKVELCYQGVQTGLELQELPSNTGIYTLPTLNIDPGISPVVLNIELRATSNNRAQSQMWPYLNVGE